MLARTSAPRSGGILTLALRLELKLAVQLELRRIGWQANVDVGHYQLDRLGQVVDHVRPCIRQCAYPAIRVTRVQVVSTGGD